jgi:hypothetical protein
LRGEKSTRKHYNKTKSMISSPFSFFKGKTTRRRYFLISLLPAAQLPPHRQVKEVTVMFGNLMR